MAQLIARLVQFIANAGMLTKFIAYMKKVAPTAFTAVTMATTDLPKIITTVTKYVRQSPKALMAVLSGGAAAVGTAQIYDFIESDETAQGLKANPVVAQGINMYKMLAERYNLEPIVGPDGDGDAVWGVDNEDIAATTDMLKSAMPLIRDMERAFGSIELAERVYMAIKMLEPGHFAMYKQIKAMN